jgi:uncharacterized membrane protein YbhN (UPF0104 family)
MVAWPPVIQRILALTGVPGAGKTPPAGVVAQAALVNLVAWIGYGLAFWLLARGVVPDVRLAPLTAVAAFAASYVAGLIALFAPAGLVVREGLLIALLQGVTGPGAAAVLAVASRILLTIAEVGAAAPFILLRVEKARVG